MEHSDRSRRHQWSPLYNQIDIEASPEAVFDELSDVRHEQRWSDKLTSVELLTPEPVGLGSRLRAKCVRRP